MSETREEFVYRTCQKKRRFRDKKTAIHYRNKMRKIDPNPRVRALQVYACEFCFGYHIGHSNREKYRL